MSVENVDQNLKSTCRFITNKLNVKMDPADIPSEDTSSTSSESEDEKEFVFYKNRKEWQDIQPISLDEGDFPIVAIAYSDKFKDVFGYFRAVVLAQEKSQRALDLTKDAAELNPANYTVWQYRRILLRHLNVDLHTELKYLRHVMEDHPKNYQVWHHRRMVVEWLNDPTGELRFTEIILSQDAKNYHAWQHRQWVLTTFNLFENELNYVDRLLQEDIRNNSAWNQRYFVINHTTGFTSDVIPQEIQFVARALSLVSHNESAWNYLRGILLEVEEGLNHPEAMSICQNLRSVGKVPPFLLAFEVDAIEELLQRAKSQELLAQALEKCQDLAQNKDTIRAPYWTYIAQTLTTKYS